MYDELDILREYERLQKLDPLNQPTCKECLVNEVDWGLVHRLETVAPIWVNVPELPAAAIAKRMKDWKMRVQSNYPDTRCDFRAYLFVYPEGDEHFEYDSYQTGTAKYAWRDPVIQVMPGLSSDLAAIYRAEDMSHKKLYRLWARHHTITAQVSRAAKSRHLEANTLQVRKVDSGGDT